MRILLAENNWRSLPLEQMLRAQLEPMGVSRTMLAGPSIAVSTVAVQPLGLVAHELMLNSIEHGALFGEHGRFIVEWFEHSDTELGI